MRKGFVVLLAVLAVAMLAAPATAEISFFGTARVLPTFYSNFDFDDNKPDAGTLNEGGTISGEHIRSELRLGWKAGGDKWKIMMIAEADLINEKDTVDRSFYFFAEKGVSLVGGRQTPNAGSEFGIERVELNYAFTPALVLSTGWNIRAADIKTGGLLFGDDHPFIELGGKITENFSYALDYITVNNRQLTAGASPVTDDWRVYMLKLNALVGAGNMKFDLSPTVLFSDNRMRNAEVYYYGFEATGQIGIFKPYLEFFYADGEIKPGSDNTSTTIAKDIKAYAAFAGVEAAVSKALNPYIAIRYATGDDNGGDNDVEGFVGITDIGRFTPLMGMDGNILGETMLNPYGNVLYAYSTERKNTAVSNIYGGISNGGNGNNPGHMIIAFGSKGEITPAFSYKAQAFLIWYDKTNNILVGAGQGVTEVDDYAGTTVDLQLAYKFSPNFSTYIIGSAFVPGDGIKQQLAAATADDTFAYLASLGLVWTY
jgi:hypothetical protein